jgi:hypothetical protein
LQIEIIIEMSKLSAYLAEEKQAKRKGGLYHKTNADLLK